ncbi:excisionase family DNA-binding protein [Bradyrhizobium sp. MOS003]|uniref:excisionase family DNA-binding protein n=1 Tax=Bradyrhizobium sp. MOS003 TaxID=2133946 RepID=UPI000D127C66|nr:excisionase family DNA-binding protein [Bradyrhizobium sp. MOS003]PSO19145.1 hypothetical protein C7G42_12650 [Bradyrhizobium sp. MOS003]
MSDVLPFDLKPFSIAEAARELGISRSFLFKMIADGRIETVKLGRRTLIKGGAIRKALGA